MASRPTGLASMVGTDCDDEDAAMTAAPAQPEETVWHLYLVRTREGDLYTGIAKDVERRIAEHQKPGARGAKYLRGRGPIELSYRRKIGDHALALRVEHGVKRLSKERKEGIVRTAPDTPQLLTMLALAPPDADSA